MPVESALFFESLEQIYERIFRSFRPRTPVPRVRVRFRRYANANSRIRLAEGHLTVDISDLLESAPAPIHEALATILVAKLFRKIPDRSVTACYRRYLNRADVRRTLHLVQRERGRKTVREPRGRVYDLCEVFEGLNQQYFFGLMARPELGWSMRPSRSTLGHYDPCHHMIVLNRLLDSEKAPELLVKYIMFHEMLHVKYPTQHRASRRCVHTQEFKQAERQFEGFEEAKRELKRFVDGTARNWISK